MTTFLLQKLNQYHKNKKWIQFHKKALLNIDQVNLNIVEQEVMAQNQEEDQEKVQLECRIIKIK